tara:strand:+ start:238 stop:666 length:429 start_codon:yes stop_codon:yes gene_type:complete
MKKSLLLLIIFGLSNSAYAELDSSICYEDVPAKTITKICDYDDTESCLVVVNKYVPNENCVEEENPRPYFKFRRVIAPIHLKEKVQRQIKFIDETIVRKSLNNEDLFTNAEIFEDRFEDNVEENLRAKSITKSITEKHHGAF